MNLGTDPDRPFDAPWQAQRFATTVALNEAGHLPWHRWADAFGAALAGQGDAQTDNATYYAAWLDAFETVLIEDGIAAPGEVSDLTEAWHQAARATPHGHPINLATEPDQPGR